MTYLLRQAIADSTRATYSSGARSFLMFAAQYHRWDHAGSPLPVSEETLMLFVTYLTYRMRPQSIKVYLYAVRNLHLEHGFPSPLDGCIQLERLMQGIKRTYTCGPNTRLPVTPALLRSFASHLNLTHYDHCMIWAAMLLAFFGFLRSSELLNLQANDVTLQQDHLKCTISASKTDPFRKGTTITLATSGDATLCPVQALRRYMVRRPPSTRPLFHFSVGTPLSRKRLNQLVRDLAERVGIPAGRYSTHSFRIGAATTSAAAGIPDWKIRMLGRWLSDAYQLYVRTPADQLWTVPATLARTRI